MNTTPNTQTTQDNTPANSAKAQDTAADQTHPRDQLRRRVEARVGELEASLSTLKSQQGNAERVSALETELQLAKDNTTGGWDKVGEVEAAKLSQWLEGTQSMTETGGVPKGATVPGQVANAIEEGRTTVESSYSATSKPGHMPKA